MKGRINVFTQETLGSREVCAEVWRPRVGNQSHQTTLLYNNEANDMTNKEIAEFLYSQILHEKKENQTTKQVMAQMGIEHVPLTVEPNQDIFQTCVISHIKEEDLKVWALIPIARSLAYENGLTKFEESGLKDHDIFQFDEFSISIKQLEGVLEVMVRA